MRSCLESQEILDSISEIEDDVILFLFHARNKLDDVPMDPPLVGVFA